MPNADDDLLVRVLLDRLQFTSEAREQEAPPKVEGFTVISDHWVRPQTDVPTYGRSREFRNRRNYAQIFWQYQRRCPWLRPWKITLIADDRYGLTADEVWSVVRHCRCCRILIVELALDFCVPPPVNDAFVRRHGIFGKSRRLG
jgi:hypothetical protein